MIHVISLGAGVQSSTMALMAAHGEIEPMPQCAIFADTGWEPKAVYEWLDWLEKQLPFPVYRVTSPDTDKDIKTHTLDGCVNGGRTTLPFYVDGDTHGIALRKCTDIFKVRAIERFLRFEILGLKLRQRGPKTPVITQWRGISSDEASRMKASTQKWLTIRYPLAMEHRMTRHDCLAWMNQNGYPKPSRSACIGCPYHSNDEWRDMKSNRPDEWAEAVDFDKRIRQAGGMRGRTFLHPSRVPLDEVDLDTAEDHGQVDMFKNDCEGMCGV